MLNKNEKLKWSEYYQSFGVFRQSRKHPKTGQILYARDYGKKAWFIPVAELDAEQQNQI